MLKRKADTEKSCTYFLNHTVSLVMFGYDVERGDARFVLVDEAVKESPGTLSGELIL